MYSKEELIAKAIPELLDIAHSMGAVTTGNSDQESLAYAILDKQAEDEGNKNPLGAKRRRTRIIKKESDKVYTVNGKEGENFDLKKNINTHKEEPGLFANEELLNKDAETPVVADEEPVEKPKRRTRKTTKKEADEATPSEETPVKEMKRSGI